MSPKLQDKTPWNFSPAYLMGTDTKILVIYTGGTIGMIKDPRTGALNAFDFQHINDHVPELQRFQISLTTMSFEQPIDSSEMTPQHWVQLANLIVTNYDQFDGFVLLHGSDTMAFTASALSFMLQGLKKPVILTGSQLPIGTIRTDGKENLITAIEIAADRNDYGEAIVQEVAVYFEYSLYRGNRCSKISANQFEAFDSPNYPELAVAGVDITYHFNTLFRTKYDALRYLPHLNERVALLKITPGFPINACRGFFDRNFTDGVVLETFGSGNAPSNREFQQLIETYIASGGMVLNTTQCSSGAVEQGKYATSSFFNSVGVISGKDLTTEAAVTKMMFALANSNDTASVRTLLEKNSCGELSGSLE
jgi:L-asparaginase